MVTMLTETCNYACEVRSDAGTDSLFTIVSNLAISLSGNVIAHGRFVFSGVTCSVILHLPGSSYAHLTGFDFPLRKL